MLGIIFFRSKCKMEKKVTRHWRFAILPLEIYGEFISKRFPGGNFVFSFEKNLSMGRSKKML